jgi:hypothetical protein
MPADVVVELVDLLVVAALPRPTLERLTAGDYLLNVRFVQRQPPPIRTGYRGLTGLILSLAKAVRLERPWLPWVRLRNGSEREVVRVREMYGGSHMIRSGRGAPTVRKVCLKKKGGGKGNY